MPALDFWDIAAKRPSCLMAVTPYRGGTWASMLRPGVAYPSLIPRNFATEPAVRYNFPIAIANADFSHDFRFEIEFENTIEGENKYIFYNSTPGNNFFGAVLYSDNRILVFSNMIKAPGSSVDYIAVVVVPVGEFLAGRHIIRMDINGTSIDVYLDGSNVFSRTNFERLYPQIIGAPTINAGYAYNINVVDLTNSVIIWDYPTWAEEKRLLTYTNVRTDRGVFEGANSAVVSSINTQLDLRGLSSSRTFICRAYCPSFASGIHISQLVSQSVTANNVVGETVFKFLVYQNVASSRNEMSFTFYNANNVIKTAVYNSDAIFDRWIVVAAVLDLGARSIKLYFDGDQVYSYTHGAIALTATGTPIVRIHHDPGTQYISGHRISHAMIFDYAMTAAEIAQFK